jgi:hypothetical protein
MSKNSYNRHSVCVTTDPLLKDKQMQLSTQQFATLFIQSKKILFDIFQLENILLKNSIESPIHKQPSVFIKNNALLNKIHRNPLFIHTKELLIFPSNIKNCYPLEMSFTSEPKNIP